MNIIIEKKAIKNMYLRILPPDGRIKVTAPLRMPDEEIQGFIEQKKDWIQKKQKELLSRTEKGISSGQTERMEEDGQQEQKERFKQPEAEKRYETGEYHYLWGEKCELVVLYTGGENEVFKQGDKIYLKVKKNCDCEYRKKILYQWYRDVLAVQIQKILPECIQIVGKRPAEWHIKDMRTRWGTCNIVRKRIWLNLQLVKQPPQCLKYVMIHELVHLHEKSHNAVFKAYMDEFYPEWRRVKELLRIDL